MICDTPEAYEGQPGFEFLKAVPTTWDQTVVPNASVNEYVTIARKRREDWFVGTINNSQARSIDVDLKFLDKDKKYKITIYKDAEDTNIDSNKLVKEVKEITYRDKITLPLASDGGSVFIFNPSDAIHPLQPGLQWYCKVDAVILQRPCSNKTQSFRIKASIGGTEQLITLSLKSI